MAFKITEDCINCNACMAECPNEAIYEGGMEYRYSGQVYGENGSPFGYDNFWSASHFYVVPEKCTECKGFHDDPQCVAVCPIDCCVPDPDHAEDESVLLKRKDHLDEIGRE
jgi:ferredoxin